MRIPRQLAPLERRFATPERVWYAAYGSNIRLSRLGFYLTGGRPPGARSTCPGCRDSRQPERTVPVLLPGELYFALESPTWTGGLAFYDPDVPGETAARAYLLTAGQFSDIAAQEMHREPGADLDLSGVLASGRAATGTGRYETLICAGLLEGHPVLTFTAPWGRDDVPWNPPAAAYLWQLASGLAEAHAWPTERIADYLTSRPGALGRWTAEAVAELLTTFEVDADPV